MDYKLTILSCHQSIKISRLHNILTLILESTSKFKRILRRKMLDSHTKCKRKSTHKFSVHSVGYIASAGKTPCVRMREECYAGKMSDNVTVDK